MPGRVWPFVCGCAGLAGGQAGKPGPSNGHPPRTPAVWRPSVPGQDLLPSVPPFADRDDGHAARHRQHDGPVSDMEAAAGGGHDPGLCGGSGSCQLALQGACRLRGGGWCCHARASLCRQGCSTCVHWAQPSSIAPSLYYAQICIIPKFTAFFVEALQTGCCILVRHKERRRDTAALQRVAVCMIAVWSERGRITAARCETHGETLWCNAHHHKERCTSACTVPCCRSLSLAGTACACVQRLCCQALHGAAGLVVLSMYARAVQQSKCDTGS